jgi:adenosylcobinamide-phosphate synthase
MIGDPKWLPHPVRWIGRVITWAEGLLYDLATYALLLRVLGAVLWIFVVAVVVGATGLLIGISQLIGGFLGDVVLIWLAFTTFATRSLHRESSLVARALGDEDLDLARRRLSGIVSRDTSGLDEAGILRALVETVSENISDGIVAPLLYLSLFGPLGALTYKAVNTMDSMLGYMNERYRYFGWFAACADDIANWVPARLSGWLIVAASACLGWDWRFCIEVMERDARTMKSPNAGYPEAAAAGALGVQLGGTNIYFGQPVEKPRLGDAIRPISMNTYRQMIKLMYLTSGLAFFLAFCVLLTMEWLSNLH